MSSILVRLFNSIIVGGLSYLGIKIEAWSDSKAVQQDNAVIEQKTAERKGITATIEQLQADKAAAKITTDAAATQVRFDDTQATQDQSASEAAAQKVQTDEQVVRDTTSTNQRIDRHNATSEELEAKAKEL